MRKLIALCLLVLIALSASASSVGVMGVGTLMSPTKPSGSQSGHGIVTESNSLITTESGIGLRTE